LCSQNAENGFDFDFLEDESGSKVVYSDCRGFSQPLQAKARLGYNCFLLNPFQFIFLWSFYCWTPSNADADGAEKWT
jgi:hypothetical protein